MKRWMIAALIAGPAIVAMADTHYVRSPETCTNTAAQYPYTSWETAATNIQWAMDAAAADETVLVSNGVYTSSGAITNIVSFFKAANLLSVNGPGKTVIDGGGVCRGVWLRFASTLSGFTLSNGSASCGGGIYVNGGAVATNCLVVNNICTGTPLSWVSGGGGICLDITNALVTDCTVSDNECHSSGYGGGGGIQIYNGLVRNCRLSRNKDLYKGGGGMHIWWGNGIVSNCLFTENTGLRGGGIHTEGGKIFDCSISNNVATDSGGGLFLRGIASGCTIVSNLTKDYAAITLASGATVSNCVIRNNSGTTIQYGSGACVNDVSSLLTHSVISDNSGAPGLVCKYGRVVNCAIVSNQSGGYAGGIYITGGYVSNCVIFGNSNTVTTGGGVGMSLGGVVCNCLINGNYAQTRGGGVYMSMVNANTGSLSSCTIVSNRSVTTDSAAGVVIYRTNEVVNCVIASNRLVNGTSFDLSFYNSAAYESNSVSYSCAPNAPLANGNINGNPQFVNSSGGDYRLALGSPCINAGLNQEWMNAALDLDGRWPRIDFFSRRVDMGAYEFLSPGTLVSFK